MVLVMMIVMLVLVVLVIVLVVLVLILAMVVVGIHHAYLVGHLGQRLIEFFDGSGISHESSCDDSISEEKFHSVFYLSGLEEIVGEPKSFRPLPHCSKHRTTARPP